MTHYTGKQLSVYIDDRTRLITSYGIFKCASATNSIDLLKTGINDIEDTFSSIKDYFQHYNKKRLHMSLRYKTPKEVWDSFKDVN